MGNRHVLPLHVEIVLIGRPDVKEALICGVENQSKETDESASAQKSPMLRAYIIRSGRTLLDEASIVNYVAQAAPDLPRINGGVVFLDKIPRTAVSELIIGRTIIVTD